MKDFLSQAGKLLKEHKQYKRQLTVFLCLAVIVAFSTVTALKLYGQAMTHKMEVLDCQYQVHQHIEDCYAKDEQGNPGTELICGYADYTIHAHNEDCYDSKGNLVCGLEEHEKHEHTDECFTTELVLVCGLEEVIPEETPEDEAGETPEEPAGGEESTPEAAGQPEAEAPVVPEEESEPIQEEVLICQSEVHAHSEGCYEKALACGQEEHVHGEGCTSQELACGAEEHAHGEGCYDEEGNLTCEVQEHAHEEACYTTANVCGAEEHTHGDECYTTNLICGIEEHEHTESCYELVTVPAPADNGTTEPTVETPAADETAGEDSGAGAEPTEPAESTEPAEPESEAPAESEPEGHVHTEACYEEVKTLVCEEQELHIHDNSCYGPECFDENGALIEGSRVSCGLLQLEEHTHAHTEGEDSCFKTVELTPEEVEALENGATLHIHEESCYDEEGNLICGHDATHIHVPECYDEAGELICGYGTASHVHEDKCYDENGELTCGYETASHVHEDSCYDAEGKLQCGYEAASHVHEDSCYDEEGELVCGYETAAHVHEDSCYDEEGKLQCGYETASHVHEDSCYDEDGKLVCGYESASHVHEESCYDEEGNLICGYETASHLHEESCYDEEGNLICGYETASHPHTEDCYDEEGNLICGYETATHVHNESCYDEEGNVICGYAAEIHEHDEDCYDEEGNLICGYNKNGSALDALYCNELVHQHDEDCYDEAGNLTCGKADFAAHTHTDECYNVEGKKICPLPEREAHVHSEACYPEGAAEGESEAEPACGKDEIALHTHTEECYDADGVLTCGVTEVLEHVHSEDCKVSGQSVTKTFENESFIITAVYNRDANIPEEAELLAEQITEESNGEHYAKRQAEYQEALGDDMATMRALLKIGFYVNGQEVEPESPVTVTIQFLNEDGLAEGKPITVIHFAEDGTELLEGSKVEGGSTTFEMESFSEIAVGYGVENVRVPLDESIDYETDAFHITFHIKGDVTVPFEGETDGTTSTPEEGNPQPEADGAEGSESSAGEEEAPAEPTESETGEEVQGNGQHVTGTTEGNVFTAPVESEVLEQNFEFKVESLGESSEEYAAVVAYGEEIGDGGEELLLQVWSYSLNYAGEEIDLSDCKVMAEITPTQALVDVAKEAAAMAIGEDSGEMDASGEGLGEQAGFVISVMNVSADAKIGDIETTAIDEDTAEKEIEPTFITLETGTFAARASGQPNPKFTVQYYANLEKVAYNDPSLKVVTNGENTNEIPVIDTDGGKLPGNGKGTTDSPNENAIRKLYVDTATGKLKTKTELTEVYAARPFEYHKAPTINYINAVIENPSYELKEVWVLLEGKETDSVNRSDWTIYPYDENLHFTNRQSSATKDYVYISDGATLRLVFDTKKFTPDIEAAFYDYDIGDGKIYKTQSEAASQKNGKSTSTQGTGTWYMHTTQSGINSPKNYSGSGVKLAFGNSNTGSGLQYQMWNGNLLNKFNGSQDNNPKVSGSYKGCTFGLADKLIGGKIQYAEGVDAPKLFNDGEAAGKEAYTNYSLNFNQVGDTYTLSAVNGTNAKNLEIFRNPDSHNWKGEATTHYHIWTNSFWPMDSAPSYGANGHDMKFGNYNNRSRYNFSGTRGSASYSGAPASGQFPWSDDDIDHNSYFGMHYQVDFDLVADYVGPLEYYFFGDDDMWVFLSSGDSEDGKLVCDIGGVHSSVGEYLNLWDYINKEQEKIHRHGDDCYKDGENNPPTCGYVDKKKFSLNFFYTERGESGSTCWMQFTLPSVSSKTPETTNKDYGHLMIQKDVKVITGGKDYPQKDLFEGTEQGEFFDEKDYTFTLSLTGPNGDLKDDYAYTKYDRNGKPVESEDGSSGGILEWETIATGETFTLKDGEYIRIQYLPAGTKYTITEADDVEVKGVVYSDTSITANDKKEDMSITTITDGKVITGTIPADDISEVDYVNRYSSYSLPETGGSGTILYTMAGGMVLLFGAGFLYKKKFRERRG